MLPNLDAVTASYRRCRSNEEFIDTFYEHFLAKSQEVSEKFRGTDFARQKLMLRQSLLAMLLFNLGSDLAREELELTCRKANNVQVMTLGQGSTTAS